MGEPNSVAENQATQRGRQLNSIAWGLFFIWVGVVLIVNLRWATSLLGFGIIILGEQGARRRFGLAVDGFWAIVGILFVAGSLWDYLSTLLGRSPIPGGYMPILSVLVGIVLIVSAFRRSP